MIHADYSPIEGRKRQIDQQLGQLRVQLATKTRQYYKTEQIFAREQRRARELIAELEAELSALNCPEEYEELPVAVVAEELELPTQHLRQLIKLGDVVATGKPAHERIDRGELARLAGLGASELLRLAGQEPAEIFKEAVRYLQPLDRASAERAYRRLEAREAWHGPHAPAYLVALELIRGDFENALTSLTYISEITDHYKRTSTFSNLERILQELKPESREARALCAEILRLIHSYPRAGLRQPTDTPLRLSAWTNNELIARADVLAAAVLSETMNHQPRTGRQSLHAGTSSGEQAFSLLVRDAIYTALYAEATSEAAALSRAYLDNLRTAALPFRKKPKLLASYARVAERQDERPDN